ncbi:ABC transporter ATP-binding protein [Acidothermaceae bacterium B102]|nr:ABC transporter ATP-binding protein [Acidothermaceae bacterium B102]
MNALDVEGVHFSYGATPVLRGISLSVPLASITAVLGPSGSGKTTLLRVLAGFERASAGVVRLAGTTIDGPDLHLAPERRRLGYVPQEGGLFPHLSVAGNVAFGLRRRHREAQRVDDLLAMVGLAGLGTRFPHELSGGQQQRVALARALALEPTVVLLDEPFSSLDAALRVSVRADIVGTLRTAGAAVVLVTHDQQEALSVADQVAVLRGGTVAQVGAPRDIYARPVDAEMAGFLGDANLIQVTARQGVADTAVGPLDVAGSDGQGVVLLRPEQLSLSTDRSVGLRAIVVSQTYQGHDSLVDVRPEQPWGPDLLRVRVQGTTAFAPGTAVVVSASGPVTFWHDPGE